MPMPAPAWAPIRSDLQMDQGDSLMFRLAVLLAFVSLSIAGPAGGAAAQALPPLLVSAAPGYVDRPVEGSGLPPVTYEEIVGQQQAAAGYSIAAMAAGAVAGVMVVNMVLPVLGYSTVPAVLAGTPVTGAALETALAASRLLAVAGAAAGAIAGQWLYSGWGH